MIQINPSEVFPIVRQLADHTSTDTFYVRAVIRNALDESILETVDLVDKGSGYFRYSWKSVYQNTMARGRYITITTSVYSDSGYATKSDNYGDELETYLIQERWDAAKMQSMGGGGPGIGEGAIRTIVKELLDELELPEQKELDIEAFKKDLTKSIVENLPAIIFPIEEITNSIIENLPEYPEVKDVDLSGLDKDLNKVFEEIKSRPKFEKTDFSDLTKSIQEFQTSLETSVESIVKNFILEINENLEKAIHSVKLNIDTNLIDEAGDKKKTDKIKKLKAKHGL